MAGELAAATQPSLAHAGGAKRMPLAAISEATDAAARFTISVPFF